MVTFFRVLLYESFPAVRQRPLAYPGRTAETRPLPRHDLAPRRLAHRELALEDVHPLHLQSLYTLAPQVDQHNLAALPPERRRDVCR